jgi:gamma-glutamyltranspeptidase/glutathione hydrolase
VSTESLSYEEMTFRSASGDRPPFALLAALLAFSPLALSAEPSAPEPSPAGLILPPRVVSSPLGMVVTSSPEATWAGVRMLEAGGNAVDAAVAAAFAQTAGDPGGSGIGGQSWMVIRLATGVERAVYCPSRAPMRLDVGLVKAARRGNDLWGAKAAGVPTTVATLAHALERYGTKSFAEALAPAVEAAESGYRIQPFEHPYLGDYAHRLFDSEVLAPVFLTGPVGASGYPAPVPLGSCVKIPGLAETLRRLAAAGASDFYTGGIAAELDAAVRAAGGFLSRADLARVPASVRDVAPVRGAYRGRTVLSVPYPAGGRTFVMALQILGALPTETLAAPSLARGRAIVEAVRLARAGTAAHRIEEDVVEGPFRSPWLTREWAEAQAARIRPDRALSREELRGESEAFAADRGTTHISVVDARGNAVSLTQTLGRYYGAAWAPPSLGFLVNAFVESLTSDDPRSVASLRPGAVAPAPTTPILLVEGDRTVLAAGAAGSSRIPSMLLNLVAGLVDGREAPALAYERPRMLWEDDSAGPRVMYEATPPFDAATADALRALGYEKVYALLARDRNAGAFGGIQSVVWDPATATWTGVVDGRRAGAAAGPTRIVTSRR